LIKRSRESLGAERQLAAKDLEGQKQLIDRQLEQLGGRLGEVATLVTGLEKDRSRKYGEITQALENTNRQTAALLQSSNALREALASTKARGQWGERMAEDVLRTAGFVEKVNYLKQSRIEGAGTTPDFTFLLPRGFRLNMDVKFPLDNYMRYLEADVPTERDRFRDQFLKDVRARVHEITDREYINPQQQTLPYVLMFIPNEQIFSFIHEQDSTILDDALRCRTLVCSPITLFAVLAVIRQAMDNFVLEQTSHEVLTLLAEFRKQWSEYVKSFDTLGKQLETVSRTYDRLTTTRTRGLDRKLEKLDELRVSRERSLDEVVEDEPIALPESDGEKLH
jgi:DNA recombination protein RmuC